MKVLFATPELPPYAKVGGLGDVVYALSKVLLELGVDVKVFCPLYGCIQPERDWQPHPAPFPIRMGDRLRFGRLWEGTHPSSEVSLIFLEYNDYFGRDGVYGPPDHGGAFEDNGHRFALFSRAAIDLCHHLEWFPDIIHCHDWTVALMPEMLEQDTNKGQLAQTATVLTLHNLEHQGVFHREVAEFAGMARSKTTSTDLFNFLQNGIAQATTLTTVSPTYAQEIQTTSSGFGMEKLLQKRSADLLGILNGIDTDSWDPATDMVLPARFSQDDLSGKFVTKAALQKEVGLPASRQTPLFGVVSRLYPQKGLDFLAEVLPGLLCEKIKAQFVILGSGDPSQEHAFQKLSGTFPNNVAVATRFDEALARRIYGGSDFFIMPSRFEPCGLSQLYAMRYGSVPIVRKTGGLADTVQPADEADGGTGILFEEKTADAVRGALQSALRLYAAPDHFQSVQSNAMAADFSWEAPAQKYLDIYRRVARNPVSEPVIL